MSPALFKRVPLDWYALRWPRDIGASQIRTALLAINGVSVPSNSEPLVMMVTGRSGAVIHHLGLPEPRSGAIRRQLQTALPGLAVEPLDSPPAVLVRQAWTVSLSTGRRSLQTATPEATAAALLTVLASVDPSEALCLRWTLGPVRRPQAVTDGQRFSPAEGFLGLVQASLLAPVQLEGEARRALSQKQAAPGWRASLLLGVQAKSGRRQRQLLGRVSAALRMAQAPSVQLLFRATNPAKLNEHRLPRRWPIAINIDELCGLLAWPMAGSEQAPVRRVTSRAIPPSPATIGSNRIVGQATYPGETHPLSLPARDALQHLHIIGPTGVGKSTLLLNLISQDLEAGRAVVVIEPKGDLVDDVLARIPAKRLDDVVVLDPTDEAPVGINPLVGSGVAELRVDQVLAVFKALFADSWGPRTQDILTAGLLTLVRSPEPTLAALPVLFTDATFRRSRTAALNDPLALGPFWAWFEELSTGERSAALAPVMNKLRAFLLRERVRRVIGQVEPRFDLRTVFTERKILLVNLAKGQLGPEASSLLGSLLVAQIWQTALGRSSVEPARRHPAMVFIDEFQDYLHLPTDLADVLAQARGLGLGLTLAHQHLGQLSSSMRSAVLANARSRVVFQTSVEDARVLLGADSRLTPADVAGLGRFEAYAALLADGQTTPLSSIRTQAPPSTCSDPQAVRHRSRQRHGVPAEEIDACLRGILVGQKPRQSTTTPADAGQAAAFGIVKKATTTKSVPPEDRQ